MFTGLVEEVGKIRTVRTGSNSAVLSIQASSIMDDMKIGDSVAVNGVCLTATTVDKSGFTADIMHETLIRSSLKDVKPNDSVNLERAMAAGGRFGGHIVSGHIDGTGKIGSVTKDDNAYIYRITAESKILRYIVEKGSITIDGISLTVVDATSSDFSVSVIPHTADATILKSKSAGDIVNLENDIIGKYVEKLIHPETEKTESKITLEFLAENGF